MQSLERLLGHCIERYCWLLQCCYLDIRVLRVVDRELQCI